jgi:Rrf2 family protein
MKFATLDLAMKLSLRGDYALRALTVLGEHYDRGVVRIQAIAEAQNIPKRFLEQILNDLRAGGFVESRRGVDGGYRLARPPEEITLAAVLRDIEGALVPVPPAAGRTGRRSHRPDEVQAAIRGVMKEVRAALEQVLEKITIADLCERARQLRGETATAADYVI